MRAVEMIGELFGRKLDGGASDYLDTLILLVNKFEDENHTPKGDHLSPQEALRAIMRANSMTQAEMARIIGREPAVSVCPAHPTAIESDAAAAGHHGGWS